MFRLPLQGSAQMALLNSDSLSTLILPGLRLLSLQSLTALSIPLYGHDIGFRSVVPYTLPAP